MQNISDKDNSKDNIMHAPDHPDARDFDVDLDYNESSDVVLEAESFSAGNEDDDAHILEPLTTAQNLPFSALPTSSNMLAQNTPLTPEMEVAKVAAGLQMSERNPDHLADHQFSLNGPVTCIG